MPNNNLTSHRQPYFEIYLLDQDDLEKKKLTTVEGGSIALSAGSKLRASGQLTLKGPVEIAPADRIRVDYHTGTGVEWPLGVFVLATPRHQFADGSETLTIELLGKLAVIDEDKVTQSYAVTENANIINTVRDLIQSTGETRISLTESAAVVKSPMVWEAGTSKLRIINDLLAAVGYWSLHTDGAGNFIVAPYTRPDQRPVAWQFKDGANAVHLADWEYEIDLASIPNKVVLIAQPVGKNPPLIGVAENVDPQSQFSHPVRGRWITLVEKGAEAVDQKTIDLMAQKKLVDASNAIGDLRISHAPLPLAPAQAVEWESAGKKTRATIQEIRYSIDPVALCSTSLQGVINL